MKPVLFLSALAAAIPASFAVHVGFGQQLQNNDQANHWVIWVEGKSACPNVHVLTRLINNVCDGTVFNIDGGSYKFGGCNSKGNPTQLLNPNGSFVVACTESSDKITCHGSEHDIVKHGKCVK